jgi:hypothetical protein
MQPGDELFRIGSGHFPWVELDEVTGTIEEPGHAGLQSRGHRESHHLHALAMQLFESGNLLFDKNLRIENDQRR